MASALMTTVEPARVALLGFGTVGQAVAHILCSGDVSGVRLTHIFNRNVARKKVDWVPASVCWTESVADVVASDVDIVVEVVGGRQPAGDWIRAALIAGKSVVTANKQLIAHDGPELVELARTRGLELRFEASVAGGIPVLRALQEGLAGDRLVHVAGVLNGTCAYVLSRMESAGVPFTLALAEAQVAGYAEADPTEDVEGADAAAKLAILTAVGLRHLIRAGDIPTRSIRPIDLVDFEYAKTLGCTIRQIARASVQADGPVLAGVGPALVPQTSGFGRISGSQNLVTVRGVFGGETSFAGSGAGGSPTAVAVVSDLLAIRAAGGRRVADNTPRPEMHAVSGDFLVPQYVRFTVRDRPGIIAAVGTAFARYGTNIEAVIQLPNHAKDRLPFVTTLEPCAESVVDRALAELEALDWMVERPLRLPILRESPSISDPGRSASRRFS